MFHPKYILSLLIVSLVSQADAAEIRLRKEARPEGRVLLLSDVAEIHNGTSSEVAALSAMELGPILPNSGKQQIKLRDIQDRLFVQGLKLTQHEFSGASQVSVLPATETVAATTVRPLSKSAMHLSQTMVADAITQFLSTTVNAEEPWQVAVELTDEQARQISNRQISIEGGQRPFVGNQRFTVVVNNGQTPTSLEVIAKVSLPPSVIVAVRPIVKGDRIQASDLQVQRLKPGSQNRDGFQLAEEVIGLEAVRNITVGQTLDRQYVRAPLMVRRGDVVELYSRSGGIQVRTRARAREEGSQGDLITVELLTDRKALLARVCGLQEVEILAGAPPVR
ncbi:MAG: flagellar basal body P-ring formation chaperone FlgA [Planctomycetota bacterium]|nr:flagellar basal body P-ring formation chaperone FlgA [Planctomycetota bacterium]